MVSRNIMVASAVLMLVVGLACLFVPSLIATALNQSLQVAIAFQLVAAGPFGFAMLNWSARGQMLGGIYRRPLVAANFTNAGILTLVLTTDQLTNPSVTGIVGSIVFLVYWASFTWLLFSKPPGVRDHQIADPE